MERRPEGPQDRPAADTVSTEQVAGGSMKFIRLTGLSLTFVLFVLGASLSLVNSASAHHCKGKHKNDPGCDGGGGGDPGAAVPLMTTFDCPVLGADHLNCPITGNHNRLQADTAGTPYVNDAENVLNRIGTSGRFALSTGKKAKKPKPRSVYWDVTHVGGGIWLPNGGILFTTTTDMDALDIEHRTVIHVGTQYVAQGGDLRALQPNETIDADLEADIGFATGQGDDAAFVRFDPYGARCNGRITSSVQVTRTDDGSGKRQWTINVAPAATACVITGTADLGDYEFGPFELVADEL